MIWYIGDYYMNSVQNNNFSWCFLQWFETPWKIQRQFIRMVEYFKRRTLQVWFTPPNCSNSNKLLSYFATVFIFELQKTDFKIFVVGEIMSLFGYYWAPKMAWLIA